MVLGLIAPGAVCAAGGVALSLEDGGSPHVVCNETPGATGPAGVAGANGASVVVTPLDGGACPYGGVRLDVDGGRPQFICNGAPGAQGPPGPPGPAGSGAGSGSGNEGYAFAGFTTLSFSGDLGGIQGAHAKCHAEFAGAHLCTWREFEVIGAPVAMPAAGAWVDAARYPSSSAPTVTPRDRENSYVCNNWTSSSYTAGGWLTNQGIYTSTSATGTCAVQRQLACCRGPQTWFRGFTATSYSGDLGGPTGAHLKCHAEFPGAHLCTWREYENAAPATPVPTVGAWVDAARYPSSSAPTVTPRDRENSYVCNNWTSSSYTAGGWLTNQGIYTSTSATGTCAVQRPLACCSN